MFFAPFYRISTLCFCLFDGTPVQDSEAAAAAPDHDPIRVVTALCASVHYVHLCVAIFKHLAHFYIESVFS